MNILAVDSSAVTATVAVMADGEIKSEISFTTSLTHSETVMPMVDEVLKRAGLTINDIDLFACSEGPGSFTGLRIGIGTVKGLSYGLSKKVCGVSTLEALAHNISYTAYPIVPIMDARRSQVYNAIYKYENDRLITVTEPRALSVDELCSEIKEKVIFVGDGVKVYKNKIKEMLGDKALFASPQHCLQRAASVAFAALGKTPVSPEELSVVYLRKPQAEREREEKLSDNI